MHLQCKCRIKKACTHKSACRPTAESAVRPYSGTQPALRTGRPPPTIAKCCTVLRCRCRAQGGRCGAQNPIRPECRHPSGAAGAGRKTPSGLNADTPAARPGGRRLGDYLRLPVELHAHKRGTVALHHGTVVSSRIDPPLDRHGNRYAERIRPPHRVAAHEPAGITPNNLRGGGRRNRYRQRVVQYDRITTHGQLRSAAPRPASRKERPRQQSRGKYVSPHPHSSSRCMKSFSISS